MIKPQLSEKWVNRFIDLAKLVSTWSKDPNTKIGAVIATEDTKDVLSLGFNGLPRGVNDEVPERSSREGGEKYFWYAHAERNAIYNAARTGRSLSGAILVLNKGVPCTGCAIGIIQAGIKKVYCASDQIGQPKWQAEATRSIEMFREAGVEVLQYETENES